MSKAEYWKLENGKYVVRTYQIWFGMKEMMSEEASFDDVVEAHDYNPIDDWKKKFYQSAFLVDYYAEIRNRAAPNRNNEPKLRIVEELEELEEEKPKEKALRLWKELKSKINRS